jgi:hypothetical protein
MKFLKTVGRTAVAINSSELRASGLAAELFQGLVSAVGNQGN